ncbi:YqjF family protein [Flavisolibacter tropicus]|uniref:DUF2071 domain-containing protein n=1 Tax=Flavisolibacter tropicus TaxID=1492898 RepID=A0A172U294_9BACT|nr:DUF2071 domain-containing protein [Flavisolibacter tropicus]ANE53127.1 hypothetical protein SY85_24300 [Flavisolibacter tropicus]
MNNIFLSAEWRNLLMANYVIDPKVLQPFVPAYTELDTFDGVHYVSLVGFLFTNTRIRGIGVPFHRTFEEVNLRFYVRYKDKGQWKRGVVFVKEIVPKRMISFVANTIYKEKYATHSMYHQWAYSEEELKVSYHWKVGKEWNFLSAIAEKEATLVAEGSAEEFITEHYWGYTQINSQATGHYEVSHPRWNIHKVKEYNIQCSVEPLYGRAFAQALQQPPQSVFLADGSAIKVMKGGKTIITSMG